MHPLRELAFVARIRQRYLYFRSKWARVVYRHFPIFGRLNGAVVIIRKGDCYLVIERADGHGYCFPGGICKRNEPGDQAARRELLEETGLVLTGSRMLFRYRESGGFSEFTEVHEGTATGELKASAEGIPRWLPPDEIERGIYRPQQPVLDYLKATHA